MTLREFSISTSPGSVIGLVYFWIFMALKSDINIYFTTISVRVEVIPVI